MDGKAVTDDEGGDRMNMEDIICRLTAIVAEIQDGGEERKEVTGETDIIQDLDFDSLKIFELMERIQDEWGVDLFEEEDFMGLYKNIRRMAGRICRSNSHSNIREVTSRDAGK